jgi:hypothetical protein
MSKRWPIIILLLCALGLLAVALFSLLNGSRTGTITVDALSERSRLFVDGQRAQDTTSPWQATQLENTDQEPASNSLVEQKTPCFTIEVPFPTKTVYPRQPDDCIVQARLLSPGAKLTIAIEPIDRPISDHSAIVMREKVTDQYQKVSFQNEAFPESRVYSGIESVSFFGVREGKLVEVVFSETNDQQQIVELYLPQLLETLKVLP